MRTCWAALLEHPPDWVSVTDVLIRGPALRGRDKIHAGERDTIELGRRLAVDVVIMDDRAGVAAANALWLNTTGTLGLRYDAAMAGSIDLRDAFRALASTNFRRSPDLLDRLLDRFGRHMARR